jgi:hypothetical protein
MQAAPAETFTSSAPQPTPAGYDHQAPAAYPSLNSMICSWLPLYEYQNKLSIALPLLPLQIIDRDSLPESLAGLIQWLGEYRHSPPVQVINLNPLPAELIGNILERCSLEDLLNLTSASKAAWAVRYHIPQLQHLHFKTPSDVEEFFSACWETQQTASLSGAVRVREHFQEVTVLTLALSEQLTSKQYERLCICLPGVTKLRLHLAPAQSCASLAPLLQAAKKHLTLTTLLIKSSFGNKIEKDVLPDEIWELSTLEKLKLYRLSITEISEKISQLKALKVLELLSLFRINSLPTNVGRLSNLETLIIGAPYILELPAEIGNLKASLKKLSLSVLSVETLPASLGQLEKLETLMMMGLNRIKELPAEISKLTALKTILLMTMMKLQALPASLGGAATEQLSLYLDQVEEVPDIGQLTALKSLSLRMPSLKTLPSLKQLQRLEELSLETPYIDKLPDEIGHLKSLQKIALHDMPECVIPPTLKSYIQN